MTQHSFPWNDVNGDRLYDAEDFMRFFAAFLKTGIVMSFEDGLRVRSAQNGMNIQIGKGSGVIDGNSYMNDEDIAIQVNVASSLQNRTDSIVLRMDKNARDTYIAYKPSDTTVVRNDIIYELLLAKISVKANATQITDADITDMRSDPTVCGWSTPFDNINVDGIVDQYKSVFAQADIDFQAWFQNLKNQLDDNQAANLQNQIDAVNNVIVQKAIPAGASLDDYKTEGEFSKSTSTVVTGAPEGVTGAFRLSVRTILGSSGIFQMLYDYATRAVYYRIGNTSLGFNLSWQKTVTSDETGIAKVEKLEVSDNPVYGVTTNNGWYEERLGENYYRWTQIFTVGANIAAATGSLYNSDTLTIPAAPTGAVNTNRTVTISAAPWPCWTGYFATAGGFRLFSTVVRSYGQVTLEAVLYGSKN
ncbi:pyocin knob domain-containing protein [Lactococcus garvieae]|uniref:Phage baseplate protein n=1 Tax=Lactococcus garvieae DCC43 TaxID=1231377 RepID=K2PTU2_9LACT|nr:pyocin knob domain-containing protein [Lactococcus garvieae]EKF50901.1 Phage baseplate protein [Lactococcus garvieae DCC43]